MHASGSGCFGRENSSFGIKSTEMGDRIDETGRTVNVTWVMMPIKMRGIHSGMYLALSWI